MIPYTATVGYTAPCPQCGRDTTWVSKLGYLTNGQTGGPLDLTILCACAR